MALGQTNTGFQVGIGTKPFSTGFNSAFSTSSSTNSGNTASTTTQKKKDVTYNPRYPGFNEADYKKLEKMVADKGIVGKEKTQIMDELYQIYYPQVLNQHKLEERQQEINDSVYKNGELLLNGNKEAQMGTKLTQLSQMAKEKFNIPYNTNDNDVIDTMVKGVPNGSQLLYEYVNGKNQDLLYAAGLKERVKETGLQKAADFGVGVAQSPGKRGYNILGQWMDKLGKAAADKLEGTALAEWVRDKAIEAFGEDEVRAFAEQRQKELAEGTAFNGREQTDIRTPLLGEERANNGWTKAGEVVGDIGTAIALTYPLGATLAPIMADSTLGGAALLGGMEGALDTAFTHYGSQGNFDIKPGEMALGTILGGLGGVATNKLSNVGKEVAKNVSDKTDDAARIAKTTSKIADKTDDANRIAGRIGQGDIDDQAKVVEGVKSITKRNGAESTKAISTYDDLEKVIKNTEKQIVSEEDDLLRQFPEKIKDWTTTETVKGLGDQVDDVTRDYLDEGIELLKKYNKNDPVAMKELDMLQNTKNTEGLTRLEAKELARKIGSKLSKKFYNSNDELRNSMSAESYEQIRRGIQNAVRDRLPDDVLKNLDIEYSNLKSFEGLADDMAEKVNTLTQKIKATGPIEKLGRKVGDIINRVTGKGIKGLVEKFLPSNMGNKINNSIDMELELAKNLKELIKLNDAIDVLNTSLNNPASKSVITSALNKFANTVSNIQKNITPTTISTATRGAEAITNETYNELLDK